MATSNVKFYEKVKELQDVQHNSEQERWKLEQELNSYIKSDKRIAKLKAARLQAYWKKICEEERRSQQRNEQLMKDFQRVEDQMASLGVRTQHLRDLKKQYEDYIERMYPSWREQLNLVKTQSNDAQKPSIDEQPGQGEAYKRETVQGDLTLDDLQPKQNLAPPLPPSSLKISEQGETRAAAYSSLENIKGRNNHAKHSPERSPLSEPTSPDKILDQMNSEEISDIHRDVTSPVVSQTVDEQFRKEAKPVRVQSMRSDRTENISTTTDRESEVRLARSLSSPIHEKPVSPRTVAQAKQELQPSPTSSPSKSVAESVGSELSTHLSNNTPTAMSPPATTPRAMSPKSPEPKVINVAKMYVRPPPPPPLDIPESGVQSGVLSPTTPLSPVWSGADKPDISRKGFYILLRVVQEDFNTSLNKEEFYRTQMPASALRKEIIFNADKGSGLMHLDTAAISMVILEQLPLMASNTRELCVLSDKVLRTSADILTESDLSPLIEKSAQGLWEKLFEHFKEMVRLKVMTAQEVGDIFAPHLVASDSLYHKEAKSLLRNILQTMLVKADVASDVSTTVSPSISPLHKPFSPNKVSPLESPGSNKIQIFSEDEDIFIPENIRTMSTVPLTETAAYKSMLSGTQSSRSRSIGDDDDDSGDDIEQQLGTLVSPGRRKSGTIGIYPTGPVSPTSVEAIPAPLSARSNILSDDGSLSSSLASPAYVPTTVDKSAKSFGSSGPQTSTGKKPAFLADSDLDTDDELDIPMKNLSNKNDEDFDFYD